MVAPPVVVVVVLDVAKPGAVKATSKPAPITYLIITIPPMFWASQRWLPMDAGTRFSGRRVGGRCKPEPNPNRRGDGTAAGVLMGCQSTAVPRAEEPGESATGY